jgi:tetratricopeptide (TPR) repeat protein
MMRRTVLAAAAGAAMSAAGLSGGCVAPGGPTAEEKAALAAAREDYDSGRPVSAETRLNPLCDPRRPEPYGEALYLRALARCAAVKGRSAAPGRSPDAVIDAAREDLETALRAPPPPENPDHHRLCHAALGHLHFFKRIPDYGRAVRHYRAALPPEGEWAAKPDIDELLFYLGVAEQRSGDWDSASRHLRAVTTAFPSGRYDAKARKHLSAGAFTLQTGTFSQITNAAEQTNRLRGQGLPAVIEPKPSPAGTPVLHVVKCGRFRTYGEALAAVPAVKAALRVPGSTLDPEVVVVP